MAFPVILIVQNISFFIFPFFLLGLNALSGRLFHIRYGIQFVALAFGAAAIISVWNMPEKMPANSLERALEVLPNYVYWVILILMITSHKEWIRLDVVYRGIFWGLLFSVLYYFVLANFLIGIPLFKLLTQNTFAFLLICYTPIVVWYSWHRFGLLWGIVVLVLLALSGFLSGSRSGSLLTLSGGVFTLLLSSKKSTVRFCIMAVIGYFALVSVSDSKLVRDLIFSLNERTYNLLYNSKQTLEEDRSYLVRLAQIEKALLIFEKYPTSGIGLNNFSSYRIKLPGNFQGAEYVVNKKSIDQKSAHNSYFGFLAEGGLLLIIPFILILGYCIIWYLVSIRKLQPHYHPIFIAIIHMSIHLYFIYAILNVFAWFLIALACGVTIRNKV